MKTYSFLPFMTLPQVVFDLCPLYLISSNPSPHYHSILPHFPLHRKSSSGNFSSILFQPIPHLSFPYNQPILNLQFIFLRHITQRYTNLFLQFGCDAKIHLDYWWEGPQGSSVSCTAESSLTTTLRKLLSVAKLETSKNKVRK